MQVRRKVSGLCRVFAIALIVACHRNVIAAAPPAAVLADHGHTNWQIRNLSNNLTTSRFACDELRQYLAQICGAILPIVQEPSNVPQIVVGLRKDFSDGELAMLPKKKAGADGYAITMSATPPIIFIAGDNSRGIVYGVYDFLEHLGCRWFYPNQDTADPEVVPKRSTLTIEPAAWAMASPISTRISNDDGWLFKMDLGVAKKQIDWGMKNRYNAMGWQSLSSPEGPSLVEQYQSLKESGVLAELERRGMTLHGPGHSFDQFLKSNAYFEQHPEWFGMRGGKRVPQNALGAQFCWSNADARRQFVENAAAFVDQAPLLTAFCSLPFDGGPACECEQCRSAGASNLAMTIAAELIERLERSRPEVSVEQVAGYAPLMEPPSNTSSIPPKLRWVWAQWGRSHAMGYDDARYDAKSLEAWRRVANGKLTICQYYGDSFSQPWVMGPFTTAMVGDRRYMLSHGVDAVYVLNFPAGYWWNHRLNSYLAGRCYYDISLDPLAEVRDYAMHYFGPKAGPLLAEYHQQWAKQIELSYRIRGGATKQDRDTLANQHSKLIAPAVELAQADAVLSHRVGKVEKLHGLAEELVDLQRRRYGMMRLRTRGDFAAAADALQKARTAVEATLRHFDTLADLQQGLVDRTENLAFIKLSLQNGISEEATAIENKDRSVPGYMEPILKAEAESASN